MSRSELEPLRPDAAAELLAGFDAPWWVAGGWAIELFTGVSRPHGDLDVAVLRRDQARLRRALAGWELRVVRGGELVPWDGETLELPLHELEARRRGEPRRRLELLLQETHGETWRFRRLPTVERPLAGLGFERDGLPVLAPEVVLLFKAKAPTVTDELDFERALPLLDEPARAWLASALDRAHADHPWRARLDPAEVGA